MKMDTKEDVLKRLNIVIGHLNKVRQMVENDVYCLKVIQQSAAVQSSLKKIDEILLKGHLNTCFRNAIKSGGGEKEVEEVLEAFKAR